MKRKCIFGVMILLITLSASMSGCQKNETIASAGTSEEAESLLAEESLSGEVENAENSITGAVKDALMNTIILTAEDGRDYEFDKSNAEVKAGDTGLIIGDQVTIYFKGTLSSESVQTVEVTRIVVKE